MSLRQSSGQCKDNAHHHLMRSLIEDVHQEGTTGLCHSTARKISMLRNSLDKVARVATSYSLLILVNSPLLNGPRIWTINH